MATKKELAEGIRNALNMAGVKEAKGFWISLQWDSNIPYYTDLKVDGLKYHACPLGLALIGIIRDPKEALTRFNASDQKCKSNEEGIRKLLGISLSLFKRINNASINFSAIEIAEKLERDLPI